MTTYVEEIPPALEGERLDRFVAMITGRSRADAALLVDAGLVQIDGTPITVRSRKLHDGEVVVIEAAEVSGPVALQGDESVDVPIVHVDEHLIVVDKPADLVVHPGAGNELGTLAQGLLARFPELAGVGQPDRPGIVHRLDRGTSGLLAVARTTEAYEALVAALAARSVGRHYAALALGHPESPRGVIDAPIGRSTREPTRMAVSAEGRDARTHYEVQQRFDEPFEASLLHCRLETGRTHQIRVHLAAIDHPVVGDVRYGGTHPAFTVGRPFLHAARLVLRHPVSGVELAFEAPLPADLQTALAAFH